MDSYKYIIVGSGAAGVSSAFILDGKETCLVDVGEEPSANFSFSSLSDALKSGQVSKILGKKWEFLSNLRNPLSTHPKLRAEDLRHIASGNDFKVYGSGQDHLVQGRGSFAAGGMGNVWGAQLLRYTEDDFSEIGGWPISYSELAPFYSELESHIGISGEIDDMASFLGPSQGLLPPVPMVPSAYYLLTKYLNKRNKNGVSGLKLGRPRLAVLTQPYRGRPSYEFGETEFFSPNKGGVYSPRCTLKELLLRDQITYLGGHKLISFHENSECVLIEVEDIKHGLRKTLKSRHLLLGLGTIQTTRQILLNYRAYEHSLPFIDHPPTLLPIFLPALFGSSLPEKSFPIQLIGTMKGQLAKAMISFYYPAGMLWSDMLFDIPLPIDSAGLILRGVIGGMLVAQIWEASKMSQKNHLSVNSNGMVRIEYSDRSKYSNLGLFMKYLRKIGGFSLEMLASTPPPTWGFHHAATLPMSKKPGPFETHLDGRLWNSRRIRVIDGSVFPSLPAKNPSLTIMANSSRIANLVKSCDY